MNISKQLMMCLLAAPLVLTGCPGDDTAETSDTNTETDGDGDGDPAGDGDGDDPTTEGDGDGDDPTTEGDGDGDTTTEGDGDGDPDPPDPIVFPDNPAEDYVRVDRLGMPAVNTALIASKDEYNAGNPESDVAMDNPFVPEIVGTIDVLHDILDDDLVGLFLLACPTDLCVAQGGPLILPDTLTIDTEQPRAFPNGRGLADQVIDITLAVLLLNLSDPDQSPTTFADLPVNPAANDVEFKDAFPYLADPN